MGSDDIITDITSTGHPLLDRASAQRLLAAIDPQNDVAALHHISNQNAVFRATTSAGRRYYLKFHTARWYGDSEDVPGVVHRESQVAHLLRRRGIPLGYESWTDFTRSIVPRSVLVTEELPGIPLPVALATYPGDRQAILAALARYLSRLHALVFPVAGYIEYCGDPDVHPLPETDPGAWWQSHPCQTAANLQRFALGVLEAKQPLLPPSLAARLEATWSSIAEDLAEDYDRPTLVLNNYHPFHIHVVQDGGAWAVTGVYDFEAAASGNPAFDLALNDLQITPLLGSTDWRRDFLAHYTPPFRFRSYRTVLLIYVLLELTGGSTNAIPDPGWLLAQLPRLLDATTVDALAWYPSL